MQQRQLSNSTPSDRSRAIYSSSSRPYYHHRKRTHHPKSGKVVLVNGVEPLLVCLFPIWQQI